MNTSLNTQTEAEIDAQIEALIKQKELLRRTERVAALKQVADLVSAWKISPNEIFPNLNLQADGNASLAAMSTAGKAKRKPAEAKYYHAPTNTYWSGRGLRPNVFKGVDLAMYAIAKTEDPGLDPSEVLKRIDGSDGTGTEGQIDAAEVEQAIRQFSQS